jgi:hypothetical protein
MFPESAVGLSHLRSGEYTKGDNPMYSNGHIPGLSCVTEVIIIRQCIAADGGL